MTQKKKNNIIIGSLCAVVLLMVVGYAAFSSVLNIKGTSSISSNWDVEITNIERLPSNGATDVEGTPKYDKLSATFNTNLTSPGDYATYKIEITNKGSMDAVLSKITMPENTNNDINFYLNKDQTNAVIDNTLKQNDVLYKTGETGNVGYVYVTVLYRDYENQQTAQAKTASMTINFEFEQQTGEVIPTTYTGTVYSFNTIVIKLGTSTINDLSSTKTANPYYESANEVMSASGKTYFNKYTVVDDIIIEGYVCQTFGILDTPECLRGGDSSFYGDATTGNYLILDTLNKNETDNAKKFKGAGGSCYFNAGNSDCYVGALNLYANSNGRVDAIDYDSNARCYVNYDGHANCLE